MTSTIRPLVLAALCAFLVLGSPSSAHGTDSPEATASADYFMVTKLAPDLLLLSTDQGSYSNNSLVFTGKDGLLLVDTHHDNDTEAFKKFVEELGFGPPKYIISTHRHVEHIGGNALFGADPIIVGHELLPEKLKRGSYIFNEYPPEALPDITFKDSIEINFNDEVIRLVAIDGSHDDNEIMVHFVKHKVAHISSVVNGFNFPSVDSDGDVLKFEGVVRLLMTLLPRDIRLISGHHGKAKGFDFVGSWDMLPAYADMMKDTIEIVRKALADGMTKEQMQEAGILDAFQEYAGSYVDTNGWIEYVVDALTVPRETRPDIFKPIFETWKSNGAKAAVKRYQKLLQTDEQAYNFNEFALMSIGSKLFGRGLYADAVAFLLGSTEIYPEAQYGYYAHYVLAKSHQKLSHTDLAIKHCQESIRLNSEFAPATQFLATLQGP